MYRVDPIFDRSPPNATIVLAYFFEPGGPFCRASSPDRRSIKVMTIAPPPPITSLRNPGMVEAFTRKHPGVTNLIEESSVQIRRIFGPDAGIVLDVPPDYEDEGTAHLYVRILAPLEVDETLDRLDRFNEEWWWDRMGSGPDTLHYTVEFAG
jgi:hypothetical protein